jgi:hypothetical protein
MEARRGAQASIALRIAGTVKSIVPRRWSGFRHLAQPLDALPIWPNR